MRYVTPKKGPYRKVIYLGDIGLEGKWLQPSGKITIGRAWKDLSNRFYIKHYGFTEYYKAVCESR